MNCTSRPGFVRRATGRLRRLRRLERKRRRLYTFFQGSLSSYTADATVLPHTHDVVRGAEGIRDFWKSVIEAGFKSHGIELIDVHAQGDLAFETAKWEAEGPGEGGNRQAFGGSLVNVFERQSDGSWKCRLHIWN